MIVHSHKEVERYEVSCDSDFVDSIKTHLIREGYRVANEWLAPIENNIQTFILFERVIQDLLVEDDDDEDSKVKVNAHCGCYIGEPKWKQSPDDWYMEPDECNWSGEVQLDEVDWKDGCASMKCPNCNAELLQDMDHFESV